MNKLSPVNVFFVVVNDFTKRPVLKDLILKHTCFLPSNHLYQEVQRFKIQFVKFKKVQIIIKSYDFSRLFIPSFNLNENLQNIGMTPTYLSCHLEDVKV